MTTSDPILEVLREIRGDLGLVTTELQHLGRRVDYTNARLDEQGEQQREQGKLLREQGKILREHGEILREHTGILREHGEILRGHGEILRGHGGRLESLERHMAATVTAIDVLNTGVRAIAPALEQGRLRDDRLVARVDECERRIDVLEQR